MLAEIRAAAARREAKARQADKQTSIHASSIPSSPLVSSATAKESTTDEKTMPMVASPSEKAPVPRAQATKYKMMLRVGVDLCSVLRKMGEDAFDIALFEEDIDPAAVEEFYRPAYIAATQSAPSTSLSTSKTATPQSVRKKIHLPVIAKSKTTLRVSSDVPSTTLWSRECDDLPNKPVSAETRAAFDALFTKAVTKKNTIPISGGKTKPRIIRSKNTALIDKGRAQNIAILLVGMKLSTDEWRECVLSMTFNENFSGNLKMLLLAWPTSDEERAIQVYDGDGEKLGRAEEFLVGLRDIPRLKEKFECLHFRLLFSSRVFELRESMMMVVRGINQLIEKSTFAAAMQHIFRLCCVLNDGDDASNAKTDAKGFRMSALTQLLCARSFDPAVSVLGAIAQAIERDNPRLGTFAQELTLLSKCSAVSVDALRSELTSLSTGFDNILTKTKNTKDSDLTLATNPTLQEDLVNFHAIVDSFAAEAELEITGLRLNMHELDNACRRLNSYLEEPDETSFNEIITHIAAFVEAYSAERARIVPADCPRSSTSESSEDLHYFSPPASNTSDSTPCGSDGE